MVSTPRIITVDPTGAISRIVRSAMDLLDLSVIQIDVPVSMEALEEVAHANLVVTALTLDDDMKGFEFALRVKQASPNASVIILGDVDDPTDFDEETAQESPFVYMSRPVDIQKFLAVLIAGLESHEAMMEAVINPPGAGGAAAAGPADMGPVPNLDAKEAQPILDSLQADLGAIGIILADRSGATLCEAGASGFVDHAVLSQAIIPAMQANIDVKDIVGGQVSTVQLYDGEDYDVFVLSVGLHHFICVMFDGNMGARQFGLVNRFGRRAVENLIGLIGAEAFFILPPQPKEPALPKRQHAPKAEKKQEEPVELARAEIDFSEPEPEPVLQQLDPISDFDADDLFGDNVDFDDSMFDLDNMEELAKQSGEDRKGAVSWEDAEKLGLINKK